MWRWRWQWFRWRSAAAASVVLILFLVAHVVTGDAASIDSGVGVRVSGGGRADGDGDGDGGGGGGLLDAGAGVATAVATAGDVAANDSVVVVVERAQIDVAHNFLVGVAYTGWLHEHNSTRCGRELERLLQAVISKDLWTLKVLDSFGAPAVSFGWGNYFWFAAPQMCAELNDPYRMTFSPRHQQQHASRGFNVTSPFPLQFTVVFMNFTTPHYIDLQLSFEYLIHVGLCLPQSCRTADISRYTDLYFQSGLFEMQRAFALQLHAVDARTPAFSWTLFQQTGTVLLITICLTLILLIITAECVHKYRRSLERQQRRSLKNVTTIASAGPIAAGPIMMESKPRTTRSYDQVKAPQSSTLEELLLCFRCRDNCARAFTLDRSTNFHGVIAGMRTLICLWVTVFHVYYYALYAMRNAPLIFAKLENFALQPITQACFYVDVFFVISAFLLVSNFLSNAAYVQQIQANPLAANVRLFLKAILQRYLRLTPIMAITMLLSDSVYDLLNMYTPFRLGVHSGIYCKANWWRNLLYIHNLSDMRDICCSWTWYLGCEMQYYVLFTALLFLHAKRAKLAKIVFVAMAAGFAIGGWLVNYRHGITFQTDVVHSTLNELYVKPWVRINPYIGGVAFGWVFHRYRQYNRQNRQPQQQQQQQQEQEQHHHHHHHHAHLNQVHEHGVQDIVAVRWRVAFWFLFAVFYVVTNFMSYFRSAPSWLIAAIMSFGKLLLALFVGAAIVLCAWGQGGAFNTLLSARPFLLLNKFCYSIYMVAPVIVYAVFGLRNEATNFTEVGSGMDFLAITLLSIMAAFLVVVMVELPIQRIINTFVRKKP